ncbi:hypothetical protein A3860_13085 [Niastella vici]|uniref:Uncharacterized protein n=1 Tax=Niastella vici TaxID=1703345 RepID=A0A1V9G760_9BACT|nr:hypothetical protein A3860_13085 [Niastella vici]
MPKCKRLNFDTMPYVLYKCQTDTIIACSGDPETIFNQKSGLFFVPPPGLGVINKYKKSDVFRIIDSLSRLGSVQGAMHIKPF